MRVVLFDYEVGNIHSLAKALEAGGADVRVESDPARTLAADALVLPGVGAFGPAARRLAPAADAIRGALADGFPCLGICLGMQLLFDASDESAGRGLGVLPGRVRRLRAATVPHMGWNRVDPVVRPAAPAAATGVTAARVNGTATPSAREGDATANGGAPHDTPAADPILHGVPELVAYYANSYAVEPADERHVIAWTTYEDDRFPAAVRADRTWGVQFHPEKSDRAGLRVIRNFLAEAAR